MRYVHKRVTLCCDSVHIVCYVFYGVVVVSRKSLLFVPVCLLKLYLGFAPARNIYLLHILSYRNRMGHIIVGQATIWLSRFDFNRFGHNAKQK